jgi:hypothetical protein
MSWDVYLEDPIGVVQVSRHEEGGTYALGGTSQAGLNVTYNYGAAFHEAFGTDLREFLDGRRARDVIEPLRLAVAKLGTQRDPDYWQATRGNAGHALSILLAWAEQYPAATFRVS